MKKILDPKSSLLQTATLRAKLRCLMVEHHQDIAELEIENFDVREAWSLKDERVKVHVELKLNDGSYRNFTRIVPFALPPAVKTSTSYRDWTIITRPTWYGYRYELLDDLGAAAGQSESDLTEAQHVEQNARREVDRLIVASTKIPPQSKPAAKASSDAPAAKEEDEVESPIKRLRARRIRVVAQKS